MKIIDTIKKIKYEEYFNHNFDWNNIKFYQNNILTKEFIDLFYNKINWRLFCYYSHKQYELSIKMRMKYCEYLYWNFHEFLYYNLTTKHINFLLTKDLKNQLNWDYISRNCKLDEKFIIKYKNKVNWHYILEEQKLSKKFRKKYRYVLFENNDYYKLPLFKRLIKRFNNYLVYKHLIG